jgi:CxxC motif-containing protein (DUF1111 family)
MLKVIIAFIRSRRGICGLIGLAWAGACSDPASDAPAAPPPVIDGGAPEAAASPYDAASGPTGAALHAVDVPIDGLSPDEITLFNKGDGLFGLPFREVDGLGPYYVRSSCSACHAEGTRGPGLVQKMVVVEADGITTAADQSLLPWGHTVRRGLAAGAKVPLVPPSDPRVKVSTRVGPPVLGRGYMEAVTDAEIERMESEQALRTDGIHGHVNRVVYGSVTNTDPTFGTHNKGDANLVGRFGLKARIVSLDDFTADAFQGDMGITTPMRPTELDNPDGLTDDAHPGVDIDVGAVNTIAGYLRRIAIPVRVGLTDQGRELFDRTKCSVCHVPSLKTRPDYPIKELAGIDAPIFTDMLVHDMGVTLADGMTDGTAGSRAWRTSPLIGLRFSKTFLHDGRVTSVEDAIKAHDGEASSSSQSFSALSASDRDVLLRYVEAL